ncbi:ATP-binding cassette domain-containing protein [Paenibacillus sp. GCM10023250]|uniref:ATP-binding cassette domain-containing protein n=1 Tax=Paenibacillus sp. GCM10023250 TaxID=3252648 RepID=UPI0036230586
MNGMQSISLRLHGIRLVDEAGARPGSGTAAAADVLELAPGTITVLAGANGAGKTRLLETIAGLREPAGLSAAFGDDAMWLRKRTLGRTRLVPNPRALLAYAYACQSPEEQLFLRTVREELRYSLRPYALSEAELERRTDAALRAVDWDRRWLARDPYAMSGGERRRTALACLFAPPAAWLLLDEPTAGLDADGHELLAEQLRRRASEGQGVLLISHESDWAFALADRILLLHADGAVRACSRSELLANPQWLAEAGMDVPDWLKVARIGLALGAPEAAVWDPRGLAGALAALPPDDGFARGHAQAAAAAGAAVAEVGVSPPEAAAAAPAPLPFARAASMPARQPFRLRPGADDVSPIARFDARAVWLTYILVSTAILNARGWTAIGASAALAAAAVYFGRIPLRRWKGAIRAIATFTVAVSLFAGFGGAAGTAGAGTSAGDGPWNAAAALESFQSLVRPFIVMLLGFGLPIAVTPLRLRRALEQLFARFGRMPAWGTKLLLTITLLLRFVPVLLAEWERFARIAAARGKRTGGFLRGGVRRIVETALPFMLSLFRLGDAVTDALKSRGVGAQTHPTLLAAEAWRARDTVLVLGGAAVCAMMWL